MADQSLSNQKDYLKKWGLLLKALRKPGDKHMEDVAHIFLKV